jgi:hypothetical protein
MSWPWLEGARLQRWRIDFMLKGKQRALDYLDVHDRLAIEDKVCFQAEISFAKVFYKEIQIKPGA